MATSIRGTRIARTAAGKVKVPALDDRAIDRPRLLAALDACLADDGHFAMLSAPAGFGKTYLLTQWSHDVAHRGILVAWCTLTHDDRDSRVLWNSILDALAAAIADSQPELTTELSMLVPELEPLAHSYFLARMQELMEMCELPVALIVDCVELLEGSESEEEFVVCLQSLPARVHVAFATRSPLQTHAARINGRLVELSADSLSFSHSEAAQFLADRGLNKSDADSLQIRAEGWPAALSLAVLRVRRAEGTRDPFDEWTDPAALLDYLRREVFDDLDSEERAVMLTIGVTSLTTPDLVDTLSGRAGSAPTLRALAGANRLIARAPTDAQGRAWYHVNPLFGDFLREQVREQGSSQLASMIRAAVCWHLESGDALIALQLASELPDSVLVEQVLRRRGYEIIADGHAVKLLALAPAATGGATLGPFSRLMLAWAAVASGRPDRAEDLLANPQLDGLSADDLLEWDWLNYVIRLQVSTATGSPAQLEGSGWSAASLRKLPSALQLAVRLAEGLSEARGGNVLRATTLLNSALATAENNDDQASIVRVTVGLAGAAAVGCEFRRARELAERAIELAVSSTTQNNAESLASAHGLAGWACLELLEPGSARVHAERALEYAENHGDSALHLWSLHLANEVNFDELTEKRRATQTLVTAWPPPYLIGAAPAAVVASLLAGLRMSADLGEPRWGERLLDRARQILGETYDWLAAYSLHLLRAGRDDAARAVIAPLVAAESPKCTALAGIVVASIDSILKNRANNPYLAHAAAYRALELADESGAFYELTRANPQAFARVLAAGSGRFAPHEHLAHQLVSVGGSDEALLTPSALTTRERQILLELRTLRTVDEIAHDLLLSVNTVKTHMRGIYRKLDVSTRRQAVITAERHGLM